MKEYSFIKSFSILITFSLVLSAIATSILHNQVWGVLFNLNLDKNKEQAERLATLASIDLERGVQPEVVLAKIQNMLENTLQSSEHFACIVEEQDLVIAHPKPSNINKDVKGWTIRNEVEIQTRLNTIYLDNKVAIIFKLPPGFTVYGSNVRIHQILENLISNAIKYSDPKKISSHVKIQGLYDEHKKVIIVEDNGIGIPEKQVNNLFGMFQRFHSHVSQGSGLGLYIVKKHVNKLGGKINYVTLEQGTQFILEFEN